MRKKLFTYGILCLLLGTGCSLNETPIQLSAQLQQETTEMVETENQVNITDEYMKKFFTQYLQIDEDTMLLVNQRPTQINDDYWSIYKGYENKTNEIIGDYLSTDAKKKLSKQYLHDDFHYPRLLEMNGYMIVSITDVEDATIISKSPREDKNIYEVMVTAKARVVDLASARKMYRWNEDRGYYTKTDSYNLEFDKIKIHLNYWVELHKEEELKINSVKEKNSIALGADQQVNVKNNYFISRIPFQNDITEEEQKKVHKFIEVFLKQEYNFYKHYEKAYNTNYDAIRMVLESDLGLRNIVTVKEENYTDSFNPSIIPLKDDMMLLTFASDQDVTIVPHISSSEKKPIYEVTVKADVTLINGEVVTYEYSYLFVFEDDTISSVRLITLDTYSKDHLER